MRGTENGGLLYRPSDGWSCATGFACLAAGVGEGTLRNVQAVDHLPPKVLRRTPALARLVAWNGPEGELAGATGLAGELYRTNDDAGITDAWREAELIRLGRDAGFRFEFTGGEAT